MFRDVYIRRDVQLTAAIKARAAWLSTGATLCGVSAAAVHGTEWLDAGVPAEIVRANPYPQKDMVVRRYELTDEEVCLAKSMRVTTPARTAFDLGRRPATGGRGAPPRRNNRRQDFFLCVGAALISRGCPKTW